MVQGPAALQTAAPVSDMPITNAAVLLSKSPSEHSRASRVPSPDAVSQLPTITDPSDGPTLSSITSLDSRLSAKVWHSLHRMHRKFAKKRA
jgi:hypothetical protein